MARRDGKPRQQSLDVGLGPAQASLGATDPAAGRPPKRRRAQAQQPAGAPGESALSVGELVRRVKRRLDSDDGLQDVWVRGEVSGYHKAASRHIYFDLKDDRSIIKCAFFHPKNRRLRFDLEDGLEVVARGNVSIYPARGVYQLYVEEVAPVGEGALFLEFLQLKERLHKEGLFDAALKRDLPRFPRRVGVVTSKGGAAVRDVIDVATRRFPGIEIVLCDVRVQGEGAAAQVAAAIRRFNDHPEVGAEVLIVGRGGGSLEDLWAFNEEVVARAIAESRIPVVSAVGHETDTTIADMVADVRAPTPSAAAELVVPDVSEVARRVADREQRLRQLLVRRVEDLAQRTDDAVARLSRGVEATLEGKRRDLSEAARVLQSLSPLNTLARGYAAAQDADGRVVRSARDVAPGDALTVRLRDGRAETVVKDVEVVEDGDDEDDE